METDCLVRVSFPVEFIDEIGSSESIFNVLNIVARWLPHIIDADRASITLASDDNHLRLFAIEGNEAIPAKQLIPIDLTMVGQVYHRRELLIARDLSQCSEFDCQMLHNGGLGTCMDAPLICGDECYGTLNVAHHQVDFYEPFHETVLRCLAKWTASHIRIHQQLQRISASAMTDPLTNVLNRRAFMEEATKQFDHWREHGTPFVLALLDLDHFKKVNDTYGHAGGDKVLTEFASQLRTLVRQNDRVARLGGEEFAIILQSMSPTVGVDWAKSFVQRIDTLRISYRDEVIRFTCSIGVAAPHLSDQDIEMIIQRADEALYRSKDEGRNRVSLA